VAGSIAVQGIMSLLNQNKIAVVEFVITRDGGEEYLIVIYMWVSRWQEAIVVEFVLLHYISMKLGGIAASMMEKRGGRQGWHTLGSYDMIW